MLPNHGFTISQWAKPVAMVKGNVCAQPIKAAVDKGGLKSAPEPPRRMCADQIDGKQSHPLNDLCQSYDAMMLSTQKAAKSQKDAYYEGGDCQMISVHSQQPIYANYITVLSAAGQQAEQHELDRKGGPSSIPLFNHIKTKAEVHVDKSQFTTNDSKVSVCLDFAPVSSLTKAGAFSFRSPTQASTPSMRCLLQMIMQEQ